MADPIVSVTVTRSAGTDGALLVMIDTVEPLRIMFNDAYLYADVKYAHPENDELRDAGQVIVDVVAEQVAYL
jgi:hypothetical protein